MTTQPTALVNVLKVEPGRQAELIALLQGNIETVVTTLDGWRATRVAAAKDGAAVIIYSEWETPAAAAAMRADPRMTAYLSQIRELASFESTMGEVVLARSR